MSVTCSTSTCRRTRPTTCTASAARPGPAPRAMPSASRARSMRCRSQTSKVMSVIRSRSPRSPPSCWPPGWWRAQRCIHTGPSVPAAAVSAAARTAAARTAAARTAAAHAVAARAAAARAATGGHSRAARTADGVAEATGWHGWGAIGAAVALRAPLELSSALWRPPPAAPGRPKPIQLTIVGRSRMAEIEDNVDRELFRNVEKLRQLRIEHRDLDEVISRLSLDLHVDELQVKRLKKRKLMLKDQIARLESELIPDLNA